MAMQVPTIDLASFLADPDCAQSRADCERVAQVFAETGILIIRDPRVHEDHNNRFLDMMEDYFAQDEATKQPDIHPEYAYQVGATPGTRSLWPSCFSDCCFFPQRMSRCRVAPRIPRATRSLKWCVHCSVCAPLNALCKACPGEQADPAARG